MKKELRHLEKKLNPLFLENKMENVKSIFLAWSQSVDINCYTKMMAYRPNYKVQFIWLLILLGSTGATFYFISKSIIDFFNYDVVSQTTVINEVPTQFPAVTFCDNNPLSTKEAQIYMESVSEKNALSPLLHSSFDFLFLSLLNASSPLTSDELRMKLGLKLSQIECIYANNDCETDLHWFWSFDYGNCYTFNSGLNLTNQKVTLKETYRNGKDFGLSITVDLIDMNTFYSQNAKGLVVFVHNSSFKPSSKEVFVKPGELTYIQVERTISENQPSPYSDCIELSSYSSELYAYIINSGQKYRQQDCFELCLQKKFLKNCNCFFPGYQNLSTQLKSCLNLTEFQCLGQQYFGFNLDECKTNYCPLECDSIKFDLTLSSLVYPSQRYYDKYINTDDIRDFFLMTYNQTLSFDLVKSNRASFTVFYSRIDFTRLTESPKTSIADLFSQVGGALGMFVSFSIFTLFELIEIFILIIYNLLFKNESNRVLQFKTQK
jgi:hypothetical protein